jgi:hypothetical protein
MRCDQISDEGIHDRQRLRAFEGRVVALGGWIGYTLEVGKLQISTHIAF